MTDKLMPWEIKDANFAYQGPLGPRISEEGRRVDLTLWSPSADAVNLVLYDKGRPDQEVARLAMSRGNQGQWDISLEAEKSLPIQDFRGYFYHYEIWRQGEAVLALDPYARSLAEWSSERVWQGPSYKVAKAALVDPADYGPDQLTFAEIPGFSSREDAIIYELHVRDFTSDRALEGELDLPFGTFGALIERLDYIKELGVTHIQLLPVLSYYLADETRRQERLDHYASIGTNYNWGYDPQSYFALTGMYSAVPSQPGLRLAEFKALVAAIHDRGMGVILDVVYNHTAQTFIFEDLEPHYYHFMDADGTARTSFGGGRLATNHQMTRRLLVDSISYLVSQFKVDGFRFDMMGDHDAEAIALAYEAGRAINPNLIMIGEGWRTYVGDEGRPLQPADQTWMNQTDTVGVFSDHIRNSLKSGYPNEGQPAFLTGGPQEISDLFQSIKGQPSNFEADSPGDVVQYIEAHDNLTLFDSLAQATRLDPSQPDNYAQLLRRQALGNLLVLTAQGTAFLHAGQEYGRTKQFLDPDYAQPVAADRVPNKSHLLTDQAGQSFAYPYFIHDSYDSTDAINRFDWSKATKSDQHPLSVALVAYTKGLIALRRSTDAFRLKSKAIIDQTVRQLGQTQDVDLVIAYETKDSQGRSYAVFVNADDRVRDFVGADVLAYRQGQVLVDGSQAGTESIPNPTGFSWTDQGISLQPLTGLVIKL